MICYSCIIVLDSIATVCKHKTKKSLFKIADFRKKVRARKNSFKELCDECLLNDPNSTNSAVSAIGYTISRTFRKVSR